MYETLKEKWEQIKECVKEEYDLSSVSYNTWIKPLELYAVENDTVKILITDNNQQFVVDFITKRYQLYIKVMIEELTGFQCNVKFILEKDIEGDGSAPRPQEQSMTLASINANLNPRYTFESFVVGANNKFAHAAALAVAESPAERYNPLFIYGGVGLGKTHLMQSIAHFILNNRPETRVIYVSSESFTTELIDAIRKNSTTAFREKYRQADILLIDDIQFIIGKESTQEEFFHTFNFLYENRKQIIISSDKPPKAFETLEERLRSRFEMGLTVDISSPDYETRMAILRKKEELEGYNISDDILTYIATNIKSNIRELEGALTKISAYARLYNQDLITLETAEAALKDLISSNSGKEITVNRIIEVVAEYYQVKPSDIASQRRNKDVVYPRQVVMYLCREMTDISLQNIGQALKKRDHSTIIHGYDKIAEDIRNNESFAAEIEIMKKKLL